MCTMVSRCTDDSDVDTWVALVGIFSAISTEEWLVRVVVSASRQDGDDSDTNALSLWTGLRACWGMLRVYAATLHRSSASGIPHGSLTVLREHFCVYITRRTSSW